MARPSASGSRAGPWVKMVRSRTSRVTRVISRERSTTRPGRLRRQRRTRRSAAAVLSGTKLATGRGRERGARGAGAPAPPTAALGGGVHLRHEARDGARREQGRERAALQAPLVAVGGEE